MCFKSLDCFWKLIALYAMSEVVLMMLLDGGINQVDFTMSSGNRGLVPIAAKYGE